MIGKSLNCLPFVPELARLFFVVVDQSITVCFCLFLTKILRLRLFQSIAKLPKVTMLVRAPVTCARWWRPGRVETCRLGEVEMSLNSFCSSPLCSAGLFGLRRLPLHSSSAFNISCKGRCWACASSWSCWSPVDFILTVLTQAKHTCPNRRRLPKGGTSRRPLISIRVTLPLPELELSVAFSASWVHALRVYPNSNQTQHAPQGGALPASIHYNIIVLSHLQEPADRFIPEVE